MSKIVLIGGGSASGKTYVTKKVIERMGYSNITHLAIDDYYKDLSDIPLEKRAVINYDHPDAFDWKLLRNHLEQLRNGKTIDKPVYDFSIHNRSGKTESVTPNKIVIVEGIMAMVNPDIRELGDLRVFIDASRERRFLHRLIRDHNERGRSYESIISQYFATVLPMFETIIAPTMDYADVILSNDGTTNRAIDVIVQLLGDFLEQD